MGFVPSSVSEPSILLNMVFFKKRFLVFLPNTMKIFPIVDKVLIKYEIYGNPNREFNIYRGQLWWDSPYQSVIFNPWKVPWIWIAFYRNSFIMLPGFMRDETGRLANKAYFSNPIASLKQWLSDSKTTTDTFKMQLLWIRVRNIETSVIITFCEIVG